LEEGALAAALGEQIERIKSRGEWQKLACLELLFVRGWANRDVATRLSMSEQTVANFKFEFLARLRTLVRKQGLSEDVFPELHEAP
jgi:RNA polymerase sigma-70 factor (ECF subfamily)